MQYIMAKSKEPAKTNEAGEGILRYTMIYAVIGWSGLAISTTIAIAGVTFGQGTLINKLGWFIIPTLFDLISVPLILSYHNKKIIFDHTKIIEQTALRNKKVILWHEIKEVDFTPTARDLILVAGRQKIKIGNSMSGFKSLVEVMEKQLDPAMYKKAVEKINNVYAKFG